MQASPLLHCSTTPLLRCSPYPALGNLPKPAKIIPMPATLRSAMIRREIGTDRLCTLTFDRPESGANIFDAATLRELSEHLDAIGKDSSILGLIIASAKKAIF